MPINPQHVSKCDRSQVFTLLKFHMASEIQNLIRFFQRMAALRRLINKRVDGLILATSQSNDPILTLAAQQTIPTVLINRGLGDRRFPSRGQR